MYCHPRIVKILDHESLRTFMTEAENIVNGCSLATDYLNDPLSIEPLMPNHFLTMKSKAVLPPPGNFVKEDLFSRKKMEACTVSTQSVVEKVAEGIFTISSYYTKMDTT